MTSAAGPFRQGRAYDQDEIEGLLRRALAELLVDGTSFRELSVERLCGSAGIARSTFYLYFDDKAAMLNALGAGTLLRLYAAQRSWLQHGSAVTVADIRSSMRALFSEFLDDEVVMRAMAEASVYDRGIRLSYVSAVEDYARAIERFIRTGQQQGWARDVHAGSTASALAWMIERTVSQAVPGATPHRLRNLAESLAGIVHSTLLNAAPGPPLTLHEQ